MKIENTCVLVGATIAFAMCANATSLSLGSAAGAPGSSISVPLTISGSQSSNTAGLQWTLAYSATDFTGIDVVAGPASSGAGKQVACASDGPGSLTCLIIGLNNNTLPDGVVATVNLSIPANATPKVSPVQLINVTGSSESGGTLPVTGSGGSITIQANLPALGSLVCSPSTVVVPGSANCTVALSQPAPAGGATVNLGRAGASNVTVTIPSSVFIPQGSSSASFIAQAVSAAGAGTVQIMATLGSSNQSFVLSVNGQVAAGPVISSVAAIPGTGAAVINWNTDQPADSRVDFATNPTALASNVSDGSLVTAHSVTLQGLQPGITYYYRVTSSNSSHLAASWPAGGSPLSFTQLTPGSGSEYSIWNTTATPVVPSDSDGRGVELGTRFRSDIAGTVTGVRFYKGPSNSGTHSGHLWTNGGTLLGSVTFTGETASGWQRAQFASPVAINANTTYVISYYAPAGHYAVSQNFFAASAVDAAPLHALRNGTDGPNGVYRYGSASVFPSSTYSSSNYWVDVIFSPGSSAPILSGLKAVLGSSGTATITWNTDQASDSRVDFGTGAGNLDRNVSSAVKVTTHSITLTGLQQGATYYYRATSANANNVPASLPAAGTAPASLSETPGSIWDPSAKPATVADSDSTPTEVGVKFTADVAGSVTGVNFYKGPGNTGVHTGHLWDSTGKLLGTVTFANETASGWQYAKFATPIPINPRAVYVISYFAPAGHYSVDSGYFAGKGVDSGVLHALPDGSGGANGVYSYQTGRFPQSTYGSSNYWVDLTFAPAN